MNVQLRRFLILGALLYIGFLSWFFYGLNTNLKDKWSPSDMYNQVGDCPSTTVAAAPSSSQVFNAKMAVPMKKLPKGRKFFRARRSTPTRLFTSSPRRLFASSSSRSLASSPSRLVASSPREGLYMTSTAEFRTFGAQGLMYMSMPQYIRRTNNEMVNPLQVVYPYMPVPMFLDASASTNQNGQMAQINR